MARPTFSALATQFELGLLRALVSSKNPLDGTDSPGLVELSVPAPLGLADSLHAGGEVTAPAANAAICTLAAPPAGTYEVYVAGWVSAAAAADATNIELRRAGSALYTPLLVAVTHGFHRYRITLDGAQNLSVNAIGAGTASVIYAAEIIALRVA